MAAEDNMSPEQFMTPAKGDVQAKRLGIDKATIPRITRTRNNT